MASVVDAPAAAQPHVAPLAAAPDGTLSVDGFVYVNGSNDTNTQQQPTPQSATAPASNSSSDSSSADAVDEDAASIDLRHRQQLMYALHSLKMYNPDFNLTPDVLEIMRVFFDDLHPDADGTITLRALFDEIEHLDPAKELVSDDMRERMWHDMAGNARDASERIDFHGFCAWVMHWKEISPGSVRNMYTSWAQQIAMVDFGLHEADGVFVIRADELPPSDVLKTEISKLLKARQRPQPRASRRAAANSESDELTTPQRADRLARTLSRAISAVSSDALAAKDSNASSTELDETERRSDAASANGSSHATLETAASPPVPTTRASEAQGSMETVSKSFLAGGAAGIVAKSVLAPVDRVKIMFQVSDTRHFSFRNAVQLAREIYVQDGFRALFRGNVLNILRVVPYAGVQHSSFDFFRRKFHAYNFAQAEKRGRSEQIQQLSNVQLVTAGSLAGGLSLIMAYPLDIVRARYMVQQGKHQYQTIWEAIATMYKTDGARSFSRGLVPSLLGTLPYTGIGFALNEKFKTFVRGAAVRTCAGATGTQTLTSMMLSCCVVGPRCSNSKSRASTTKRVRTKRIRRGSTRSRSLSARTLLRASHRRVRGL